MYYRSLFILALAGAAQALAQPSVDQILEKYAQAVGGKAAYEKVTSRMSKGTVEIPDDNVSGPAVAIAQAPSRFRLTMEIPGYGVMETVFDGDHGWEKNPDSGVHPMSNTDLAVAKRDFLFYRETRLKEVYPKLEASGTEKLDERPAYVVQATPAEGPPEKLYFDTGSGLLVKRDFERITLEDGIVQYETVYSDYRDVDGLKLPFTIERRSPDFTMILKFAEIKNDAALKDAAFAKPEK